MSDKKRTEERWARLRFLVVGRLLAEPPERGALKRRIEALSRQTWPHPVTKEEVRFSPSTIERWYYLAKSANDPVKTLKRRLRKDAGAQPSLSPALKDAIRSQYKDHAGWSYQLHVDNLRALTRKRPELGPMRSYSTVHRYMKSVGLVPKKRRKRDGCFTDGQQRAADRLERLEVRSFESGHVNGLWHTDFHHGSRKVVLSDGRWARPILLGVLDDHSRLCCHLQWYLDEQAETLIHALGQAIQKRALPRALMTDNGAAMRSFEFRRGLSTLGIVHDPTLPYSPYQNAKQEVFWAQVEGRLMAMLEGEGELTLDLLNEATQAWSELEYNNRVHSEIGTTPYRRYLDGTDVGRPAPSSEQLRRAFRAEVSRTQRRSDGTLTIKGVRFEVPSRFRHLRRLCVRYASWDLSTIDLVDARTGDFVCALLPLDKTKNADGDRRRLQSDTEKPADDGSTDGVADAAGMAPLLTELLEAYRSVGLPPAYLKKPLPPEADGQDDTDTDTDDTNEECAR